MSLTPSGRLSAIETEKGVLQIQTEFTLVPSKSIVTSHIFSGRVVRKNPTPWPHLLQSQEDRIKAEEALARQHSQEVDFAISDWEELILPVLEEIEQTTTEKKLESLKQKLATLEGVKKVLLLDQDLNYLVIKNNSPTDSFDEIQFVKKMLDFSRQVSSVTRVGKLAQFSSQLENGQHLLQVWGEKYLLFQTEPDADLNRIKTAVQLALTGA